MRRQTYPGDISLCYNRGHELPLDQKSERHPFAFLFDTDPDDGVRPGRHALARTRRSADCCDNTSRRHQPARYYDSGQFSNARADDYHSSSSNRHRPADQRTCNITPNPAKRDGAPGNRNASAHAGPTHTSPDDNSNLQTHTCANPSPDPAARPATARLSGDGTRYHSRRRSTHGLAPGTGRAG